MKYIFKSDLSRFCGVCFCIDESTPLFGFSPVDTPRQEPSLLLWCWCNYGVTPKWPQLRFPNAKRSFRGELQKTIMEIATYLV